ncbi:hypothetical protein [Brevibacillus sp. SIMBA_040]|uniref:hypothetical protein n=1 Tax=unclassified Brevibacillus TaxID=2684853 RepID=UPI00397A5E62
MADTSIVMKNDLLLISYFMDENGWSGANKSSFQRVLYFSAALSPIFLSHEPWAYSFSNTLFGPYNNEVSIQINDLHTRGFLSLEERKVYANRIEERYSISDEGRSICKDRLFLVSTLEKKIIWFSILVKALSIYGEDFLSKLVKEDPNVHYQNAMNKRSKIITDESAENLSKEFFNFIKSKGKSDLNIELSSDQDYLLLFFDVLYQKYKGGRE